MDKKDIINFDVTNDKINKLIDSVVSNIPDNWPTIYKIRYRRRNKLYKRRNEEWVKILL